MCIYDLERSSQINKVNTKNFINLKKNILMLHQRSYEITDIFLI